MTYEEMVAVMKSEGVTTKKKELALVKSIYDASLLCRRMNSLFERYPVLGFRSFKAAGYVYHNEVWENPMLEGTYEDGVFAEVRRKDNAGGHLVGVTPLGVYFCDCLDYRYNLRPIVILEGPPQQLCCHILAVALNNTEILRKFIPI